MSDEPDYFGPDHDERHDEDPDEKYARCDCTLCWCFNETEYGVKCGECLMGAHQG